MTIAVPGQEQKERYGRQIAVVSEDGQEKIGRTRLRITGAGGSGRTAALFAAMAGFGTIRIIDPDYIKETKLNSQLLYREEDIGKPKAGTTPARGLIRSIDMIIDGLDNYPARLADAAWKCGISFIHGAVEGFYGLVCTSVPRTSTCLRCTVPNPPRVHQTPVVGVTTGVIGCVQVTEAIKRSTGTGIPISDHLSRWDSIRHKSDRIRIIRIPPCSICNSG